MFRSRIVHPATPLSALSFGQKPYGTPFPSPPAQAGHCPNTVTGFLAIKRSCAQIVAGIYSPDTMRTSILALCIVFAATLSIHAAPGGRFMSELPSFSANTMAGGDLLLGAGRDSLIVNRDTVITGNVLALGHSAIRLNGGTLEVHGSIMLVDSATFVSSGGILSFPQDYLYQYSLGATRRSTISLRNTTVRITNGNANAAVMDDARWEFHNVQMPLSFFTMSVANHGTLLVDSCPVSGEYIFADSSTASFSHSAMIISWPWMQEKQSADVTFPDTGVARWVFPDSARSHSGIFYRVNFADCHNVLWMLLHVSGASLTIRNSHVRAIGVVIRGKDSVSVAGVANGAQYTDWTFPDTNRTLRLINSTVTTWNYYPFDRSRLSLTNCIFGELLGTGFSQSWLNASTCDGTGGYFSATDSAHVEAVFSTFTCPVFARMRSTVFLIASTIRLLGPIATITAERAGSILLANCTVNGIPKAYDTSLVVLGGIDGPARVTGNVSYDITGAATIINGPLNAVRFTHYSLSYAPKGTTNFTLIGDIDSVATVHGVLGNWRAPSVPGSYILRVCLAHNFGDSLCITADVEVDPPNHVEWNATQPLGAGLALYPLPAASELSVRVEPLFRGMISVYDALGRTVRVESVAGTITRIDLQGLPAGAYQVRVAGEDSDTRRVILIGR
jgi:hypothetical protein